MNNIFSGFFTKKQAPAPIFDAHLTNHMFTVGFDGEKNEGELGVTKNLIPIYTLLRARSWQSFLESEITMNVMKKFQLWIIGSGLRLESIPKKLVLESNGFTVNPEEFSRIIEANWQLHTNSTDSVFEQQGNLHKTASEVLKGAYIAGDELCVLRYSVKTGVNIQRIDSTHIRNPFAKETKEAKDRGNFIAHGIEMNAKGRHVAYFVHVGMNKVERVPAKKQGRVSAFMVYGLRYRKDDHRGIPLITAVLETLKKLERYKEATVGSAEEIAKIAYYIYHKEGTSEENPMASKLVTNLGKKIDPETGVLDHDVQEQVYETTAKQAINMPAGAELRALTTQNDLYFKEFYETNFNIVCACLGIPPEVASDKYDSNFSSARAALKSWEHNLIVQRKDFADQFYKPYYEFWLETEARAGTFNLPDFLQVVNSNRMAKLAYLNAAFIGVNIPHIDPLKEVEAERLKLGNKTIPLTTVEKATAAVNGGDSVSNIEQFREEEKSANDLNKDEQKLEVAKVKSSGNSNSQEPKK